MFNKSDLIKINDYLWEIPKSYRKDMLVPARIYISEKMLEEVVKDRSLNQLVNLAALPGIVKYSLAMPDIHEGYGAPIGGVFATKLPDGIISPGSVGYDINCGVRLLRSEYTREEIKPYLGKLIEGMFYAVPSGVGKGGEFKLSISEMDKILGKGIEYIKEKGYATEEDVENCESGGCLKADPCFVSDLAKKRGRDQLGTLGAGNHFIEIQEVNQIYDEKLAKKLSFIKGQIAILIHTGSRGLGHQVATDYIRCFMQAMGKYKISLPDRELAAIPFSAPEGKEYFLAMGAAANFAWTNRQIITYSIRNVWKRILGLKKGPLDLIYDIAHNIAKVETYYINGKDEELLVHRKGATRAFPGQLVLIPGSMGTFSYVLSGTEKSKESFFSACHGAGRTMSRHEAKRKINHAELLLEFTKRGIIIKSGSVSGLVEEAPLAYKNVDEVVEIVHQAGLAKKIVQLKPLAVIKG